MQRAGQAKGVAAQDAALNTFKALRAQAVLPDVTTAQLTEVALKMTALLHAPAAQAAVGNIDDFVNLVWQRALLSPASGADPGFALARRAWLQLGSPRMQESLLALEAAALQEENLGPDALEAELELMRAATGASPAYVHAVLDRVAARQLAGPKLTDPAYAGARAAYRAAQTDPARRAAFAAAVLAAKAAAADLEVATASARAGRVVRRRAAGDAKCSGHTTPLVEAPGFWDVRVNAALPEGAVKLPRELLHQFLESVPALAPTVAQVSTGTATYYGVVDTAAAAPAGVIQVPAHGAAEGVVAAAGAADRARVSLIRPPPPQELHMTNTGSLSDDAIRAAFEANTTTHVFQTGQVLPWLSPYAVLTKVVPCPAARPVADAPPVDVTFVVQRRKIPAK
jgi:hypothetical protein